MIHSVNIDVSKNTIFETYSGDDYDRFQIDSLIYRKSYKRVSSKEWSDVKKELNYFKLTEMLSHKNSIHNINLIRLNI